MRVFTLLALLLSLTAASHAAQTAPATQDGAAGMVDAGVVDAEAVADGDLEIRITAVEGIVRVREAQDAPWRPAEVGMQLGRGAEFRTGPRSAVQFVMPPDQTVTLDRLGTVTVLEAARRGGKVKTDLGMAYGRTRYSIEQAGIEHESTIHSPSATLAVRGTEFSLTDTAPFPAQAVSLTGKTHFKPGRRAKETTVGSRGAKRPSKATTDKPNPADYALDNSAADPSDRNSNTAVEDNLIASIPNVGAFSLQSGFGGVRDFAATGDIREQFSAGQPGGGGGGGPPPVPLQGRLNFTVDWTGPADLDMFVISPSGEGLAAFPSGGIPVPGFEGTPSREVPSGGKILLDDTSANGVEQANWQTNPPRGTYTVGTRAFSLSGTTTAKIDGFLDGRRIKPTVNTTLTSQGQFVTTTFNVRGAGGERRRR